MRLRICLEEARGLPGAALDEDIKGSVEYVLLAHGTLHLAAISPLDNVEFHGCAAPDHIGPCSALW